MSFLILIYQIGCIANSKDKLIVKLSELINLPISENIVVTQDGTKIEALIESKWVDGRFDKNIRIDHPTNGAGK